MSTFLNELWKRTLFVNLSEIESQYKCTTSMVFVQSSKILSQNKCTMHGLIAIHVGYKKEWRCE